MVGHRTQIKIVGEILDTATQEIDEYEGTTITHIIREANISHGRLSRILNNLVSQGLLEQVTSKDPIVIKPVLQEENFLQHTKLLENFRMILA